MLRAAVERQTHIAPWVVAIVSDCRLASERGVQIVVGFRVVVVVKLFASQNRRAFQLSERWWSERLLATRPVCDPTST
jgi:hypothetical protein